MRQECETLFDELSDWLDGQRSERVETHLASCSDCRQVVEALRELPRAYPEPPALPVDFAVTVTRRAVHSRPGLRWRLPSIVRGDHPLFGLLETQARRMGVRGPSFWLALVVGLYGLPALLLWLTGLELSARFFLGAAGLALMLALPAYYLRTDVALLQSLVKGRCLDELLTSGLSAAGIADALAGYSLRSLVRVGIPVALVLALGAGAFPEPGEALLSAAIWLPVTAAVFVVTSYLTQALLVAPRVAAPAVLAGLTATVAGTAWGGVDVLVVAGVVLGMACRSFTVSALQRADAPRSRSGGRNQWVLRASENPIVHREMARLAGALPAGLAGLFLARLTVPFLVLVPAGFLLDDLNPSWWSPVVWGFLLAVGWLAFLRTALRTSSALAEERERGTLESLLASPLGERRFVRGWLRVACVPVYLEMATVMGVLALLAVVMPEAFLNRAVVQELGPGSAALAAIALLVMPWAGAWEGLAVSARTESRREAGGRALAAVARTAWMWLLGWGGLTLLVGFLAALLGAELQGREWTAILGPVTIVATLGLVALSTIAAARRAVETELAWRWGDAPLERPALRAPRLVLFPAAATVLVAALQAGGLVGLVSLERLRSWQAALPIGLAVALLVVALAVVLLRPAARVLADRALRSLPSSLGLGAGFGALLGALISTSPLASLALARAQLVASGASSLMALAWYLAFGLALGAAFGGMSFVLAAESSESKPLAPTLPRALAGVALTVVGVALIRWFVLDLPREPRLEAEQVYQRARQREEARLAVAPRDNGFAEVATAFMRIDEDGVGARGVELNDGLKALSWAVVGSREEILAALKAQPEKARSSTAAFDSSLPRLQRALDRPVWVFPPRWDEGMQGLLPNFILMRGLSQSLWVRALVYEREGDYERALEMCLLNLDWADQMAGQGPIIHGMIVTAMEAIAGDALLDLLQRHRFAPEAYRRILSELSRQRWTEEAYLQHLDDEMAWAIRALREFETSQADLGLYEHPLVAAMALPRIYKERELWLYCSHFLRWREQADGSGADSERVGRQIEQELGHTSLAAILMPNLARANQQVHLSLTRLQALRTVARLELYRAEHGVYPETLSAIGEPVDRVSRSGRFSYRREGDSFRLESRGPVVHRLQTTSDTRVWF